MMQNAMAPFGLALRDYFKGNKEAITYIVRDDGHRDEMKIAPYFRNKADFSEMELFALQKAKGKVLDLGAGTGVHTLELQKSNLEVDALDISVQACEIMISRGVKKAICGSIYDQKQTQRYDTILSLGRSIGFVGDLKGMRKFLQYAKSIMKEKGQILFDSSDIRSSKDPIHVKYRQNNVQNGRYFGEIRFQIEFQGKLGDMFHMLQIDPKTLQTLCDEVGLHLEVIFRGDRGSYLAKITRK
ncbi:hypothetical protein NEF87_003451 [Candidatus Lokiarchaeum ossiferum]|uniref:Class I SAM-dependent methyltransferase n=1 Tax=Candidatus Lokiarchaeum ossiferum TaxID=2951803 RepID=A0ABY6HUS4_9ARCH|nr:hypothetical protein NEF87_003451 [Candidatus Lokiarchaeum sp. B-35]